MDPSGQMTLMEAGFVTAGVGVLATISVPTLRNLGYGAAANRAEGLARAAFAISTMLFIPHPAVIAAASDEASAGLRQIFSGKRELTLVAQSVMYAGGTQRSAELASAVVQVLGGFGPQLMSRAIQAQAALRTIYTQFVSGQGGAIVIGRFPAYLNQAQATGANALNIPWAYDITKKIPGGFWNLINRPFIDAAIMRGDKILLASPLPTVAPLPGAGGQGYWAEIQYLYSRGFRPTGVGAAGDRMAVTLDTAI